MTLPFISYDPRKREQTLIERNLDFARANEVFAGRHYSAADERTHYPELRWITVGLLESRMVVVVWTPRGEQELRIISMRKANEREQKRYSYLLERSG